MYGLRGASLANIFHVICAHPTFTTHFQHWPTGKNYCIFRFFLKKKFLIRICSLKGRVLYNFLFFHRPRSEFGTVSSRNCDFTDGLKPSDMIFVKSFTQAYFLTSRNLPDKKCVNCNNFTYLILKFEWYINGFLAGSLNTISLDNIIKNQKDKYLKLFQKHIHKWNFTWLLIILHKRCLWCLWQISCLEAFGEMIIPPTF